MTEDPLPKEFLEGSAVEALHVPVPDYNAPTLDQVELFIQKVKATHEAQKGVAVHCKVAKDVLELYSLVGWLPMENLRMRLFKQYDHSALDPLASNLMSPK